MRPAEPATQCITRRSLVTNRNALPLDLHPNWLGFKLLRRRLCDFDSLTVFETGRFVEYDGLVFR